MATDLQSFSETELRMRWQEPYLTEGLNAKLAVHTPPGIYRGFRLSPNAAPMTLSVRPDLVAQDHVAVYQTLTGYSITLRRTGGQFNLNLTPFAGQTVVIAIFANYAIGLTTSAVIRVYQVAPLDEFTGAAERPELIVLGTIDVPAIARPIPLESVRPEFRTAAWEKQAPDAVVWGPVLKNSSFEWVLGGNGQFFMECWERENTVIWQVLNQPNTGNWALALIGTVAAQTGRFHQWTNTSLVSDTNADGVLARVRLIKLRLYVRVLQAAQAGTFEIFAEWGDSAGNVAPAETVVNIPVTAVDPAYRLVETTIRPPAGSFFLRRVGLKVTNLAFAAQANSILIDDFQCWVETRGPLMTPGQDEKLRSPVSAYPLILGDPRTNMAALAGMMRFDSFFPPNEGTVVLDYSDAETAAPFSMVFNNRGRLQLGDRLLAGSAQAAKPRIGMTQSVLSGFTLVFEAPVIGLPLPTTRIYTFLGARIYITENAFWDPVAFSWNKDIPNLPASKIELGMDRIQHALQDAANNVPWTDTTWDLNSYVHNNIGLSTILSGNLTLGTELLQSQAGALTPRLIWDAAPDAVHVRTLLWQSTAPNSYISRLYRVDLSGALEFTSNALWTGTSWRRDQANFDSSRFLLNFSLFTYNFYAKADPDFWSDFQWSQNRQLSYDATLNIMDVGDMAIRYRDVVPIPANSVVPNQLRQGNIPKAWGFLKTAGNNVVGFSISRGFGFANATFAANNIITVGFTFPFSTVDYAVLMTGCNTVGLAPPFNDIRQFAEPHVYDKTFNTFRFYWKNGNTAPVDAIANSLAVSFVVFGDQPT